MSVCCGGKRVRRGKSTHTVTYRDHSLACNQRFMVMQSHESFLPGQYSYPFSFQVPVGIPGTYAHASGYHSNRAECTVTYTCYAEICMNQAMAQQSSMIGRAMCPIVIMQQARTPYNYNLQANIDKKVTTWCCCDKGTISVQCIFEKDVVRMDESVAMTFKVDCTKCKTGLNGVKAILKRKLYLRLTSGMATYRETNMITLPLPGCDKEEKIDDKTVKFDLSNCRDIGTPENLTGSLGEYAGKVQQTCNGRLVTVAYELHILADVYGCLCCENPPFVYAPIEILAPERLLVFHQYAMPLPDFHGDPNQQPQQYADGQQYAPQAPAPDGQNPQYQYQAAQHQAPQHQASPQYYTAGPSAEVKGTKEAPTPSKVVQKGGDDTPEEPEEV